MNSLPGNLENFNILKAIDSNDEQFQSLLILLTETPKPLRLSSLHPSPENPEFVRVLICQYADSDTNKQNDIPEAVLDQNYYFVKDKVAIGIYKMSNKSAKMLATVHSAIMEGSKKRLNML